jgi:hypothetical protein
MDVRIMMVKGPMVLDVYVDDRVHQEAQRLM